MPNGDCKDTRIMSDRKCIPFIEAFNSLPNDKILDMTKLKASADDKFNIVKITISLFNRVENSVGK